MEKQIQSMLNGDPFLFRVGSYYLLKNEKMIALIQIVERGNNYVVYSLKGTELQETTVCHAEENDRINTVCEEVFKNGEHSCNFNFSLSPIKQIGFGIYDDQKTTLSGIIENPEFIELLKKVFVRTLAMNYRNLFYLKASQPIKYYRILKSDVSAKEMDTILKYQDESWLKHLNFDFKKFQFSSDPIPKVQTE